MDYGFKEFLSGGEEEVKDDINIFDGAEVKGVMVTLWREGIGSARAIREDGVFEVRVVAKD